LPWRFREVDPIFIKMNADRIATLVKTLQKASDAYYNSDTALLDDDAYDKLREEFESLAPDHPFLTQVGAPPKGKTVRLPFIMSSLNKIKPDTGAVASYAAKATNKTWILSEKLDGISALWFKNRLYLRGDGLNGVDVTVFAPHIQGLRKTELAIRGELIVPRGILPEGTLARSWVNGQFHQKEPIPKELRKVHFVAYEILNSTLAPWDQFKALQQLDFETAWAVGVPKGYMTDEKLGKFLLDRRTQSKYDTDGIVITENIHVDQPTVVKNPTHKVAFKMLLSDQCAETTIVEVEWNPSAQGFLIPRLQVVPVVVGTARIEYVTAHNARFVVENKLAPGAKILIRRSGDVIPAVEKVVVPASEPKMPTGHPWKWLEDEATSAHIILDKAKVEQTPKEVLQARLVLFAKTFELAGLGPGIATKLVDAGITTPGKLCSSTEKAVCDAVGSGNGKKLMTQINTVGTKVSEMKLMVASAVLPRGVGETKLSILFQAQPDPRKWHQLPELGGWTSGSLHELVASLPAYQAWREAEFPHWAYPILPSVIDAPAVEKKGTVCFTGVRSKPLEAQLKAAGWEIVDGVSSKLTVLVIPDGEDTDTGKVKKARQLGTVRILQLSQVQTTLGV
jgi:NAD-dependent DNA ligase